MSNENKQLRSEKIFLESRIEEMRNLVRIFRFFCNVPVFWLNVFQVANKDMQLQTLQDRIQYLEQHQKDIVRQFEDETQIQEAK